MVLWDSSKWHIGVVKDDEQFIHLEVQNVGRKWFMTMVYANPHPLM